MFSPTPHIAAMAKHALQATSLARRSQEVRNAAQSSDLSCPDLSCPDLSYPDLFYDDMSLQMEAEAVKNQDLAKYSVNDKYFSINNRGLAADGKDLAREVQDRINLALTAINTGRANIGAQQSRFEYVHVNLALQMNNTPYQACNLIRCKYGQ